MKTMFARCTSRVLLAVTGIAVFCLLSETANSGLFGIGRPPHYDVFCAIWRQTYVQGENDCSNKAGRYARCLRDAYNREATIVIVKGDQGIHAVVKLEQNGKTFYADPTWGRWSDDLSDWGDMVREVSERDLYANYEYR